MVRNVTVKSHHRINGKKGIAAEREREACIIIKKGRQDKNPNPSRECELRDGLSVCLCLGLSRSAAEQEEQISAVSDYVARTSRKLFTLLFVQLSFNFYGTSTTHQPLQSLEQWTRVKHPTLCCCSCSCHASSCSVVAAIRCTYFTAGQHSRHNCWGVTDHRNKKWERRCWSFLSGILQSHRPFRHCKLTVTCLEGLRCMSLMWH